MGILPDAVRPTEVVTKATDVTGARHEKKIGKLCGAAARTAAPETRGCTNRF
jgi:hypothetical protein